MVIGMINHNIWNAALTITVTPCLIPFFRLKQQPVVNCYFLNRHFTNHYKYIYIQSSTIIYNS